MTTPLFLCKSRSCKQKHQHAYRSADGLVYHLASVHADKQESYNHAAKCPSCDDTFVLIAGQFCETHYQLVHQDKVPYTTWLMNASSRLAIGKELLKTYESRRARAPPKPRQKQRPAVEAQPEPAAAANNKDNMDDQKRAEEAEAEAGDLLSDDDLEEDEEEEKEEEEEERPTDAPSAKTSLSAKLSEDERRQLEEVRRLVVRKDIVGGAQGPQLFLDLSFGSAEALLRLAPSYQVVDAALTEMLSA